MVTTALDGIVSAGMDESKSSICTDCYLEAGGDDKTRLDDSRLRQPMFRLLVPSMTRKISQVNRLGQSLPLIPNNRTRLRMSLLHSLLVCQALPLVFFHSCYPYKEKRC